MYARIYRPARNAMQSGKAKIETWYLDYEPPKSRTTEPLMGWTSTTDNRPSQVRLKFDTREAAIAYAKEQKIPFQVIDRPENPPVIKAYADNFAYRRRIPWTH